MSKKQDEVTQTEPFVLCVRVRFGGEIKCVELDWNDISMQNFIQKVVIAFNITINKELEPAFVLTDNLNMRIVKNQFANVLRTFHAGSMYYINAELQPTNIKGAIQMVTPAMLENYFVCKNKSNFLALRTSKTIDGKDFHVISNELVDFAIDAYGFDGITIGRKRMIATAALLLFPGLKFKSSDSNGTEMILTSGSQFDNRLKYLMRRQRELEAQHTNNNEVPVRYEQLDPEQDLIFLKEAVIDEVDLEILKAKLNSTRALRIEKMKDAKFDFRVSLPFMLSHPKLIIVDFELANPNTNSAAVIEKWPQFSQRLRVICDREKRYNSTYIWSDDIGDMLRLLKIFPSKGKGCEKLFDRISSKLITFCVVGTAPDQMITKANIHPYIVAIGCSRKEIDAFFIVIEQHLFPLPKEFNAAQVLDVFFKAHAVFHSNYDPNLVNMMQFLQVMVYNVFDWKKGPKPTAHMIQIFEQLNETEN